MRGGRIWRIAALGVAAAVPTRAAVFTEAAEFSALLASPTALGTLDVGVNTISGAVRFQCTTETRTGCDGGFGDRGDAVRFTVPVGAILTVASLTISNLLRVDDDDRVDLPPISAARAAGETSTALGGSFMTDGNGTFPILAGGSLTGQQVYRIYTAFVSRPREDDVISFDWSLSLTVEPAGVPAPGGLPVLVAGLVPLGVVGRRRAG